MRQTVMNAADGIAVYKGGPPRSGGNSTLQARRYIDRNLFATGAELRVRVTGFNACVAWRVPSSSATWISGLPAVSRRCSAVSIIRSESRVAAALEPRQKSSVRLLLHRAGGQPFQRER